MENIEKNDQIKAMIPEDATLNETQYKQLAKMMEVTFTKDEVEKFYSKFDSNPFSHISAA